MHPTAFLQFTGIEATKKALEDRTVEINKKALTELSKSAFRIEKRAKYYVPVDTGTLMRSIHVTEMEGGTVFLVGPHTIYDAWVEFGTRGGYAAGLGGMDAQPYLRPAYEEEIPNLKNAMHEVARK